MRQRIGSSLVELLLGAVVVVAAVFLVDNWWLVALVVLAGVAWRFFDRGRVNNRGQ